MDTVMYGNVPDEDVARIVDCIERGVKEVVGTLVVEFDSVGKAPLIEAVSLDEMAERYRKKGSDGKEHSCSPRRRSHGGHQLLPARGGGGRAGFRQSR